MYDSTYCKSYADFKLINLNVTHVTQIIKKFTFCLNKFFVFVFQLVSISVYDSFYYTNISQICKNI